MDALHLKKLLAKHGIKQQELAGLLGRDKSVVSNLLQGKRQLKADEARLIAEYTGIPLMQVMGVEAEGFNEPPNLVPFQAEPSFTKNRTGAVKKDGKFYWEADVALSAKSYALEMPDDSMNLAGILPGDILLSELDRPCKKGQIVIVQFYKGRGAKTLIRHYQPPLLLPRSTATSHDTLDIRSDDVRLVSPVLRIIRNL